jgi:hypothetical protein
MRMAIAARSLGASFVIYSAVRTCFGNMARIISLVRRQIKASDA